MNLDATLSIVPLGVADVYGGLGIGFFTVDPSGFKSSTETAMNLIAGAGFGALPLSPFLQLKWIVVDGNDPLVFSVGTKF